MNILVVDDERDMLVIWRSLFEELGCQVLTAENGAEGVAQLEAHAIELVITDIRMPVADGFHLLDYLKQNEGRVPRVFVFSAFVDDVEEELSSYDIERVIRKPFSFADELAFFGEFLDDVS